MKLSTILLSSLIFISSPFAAAKVAVFPPTGINLDKSFADAFGALLASKYETIAGQTVVPPVKAAKAIPEDSNLTAAASALGVDEYLEINAVGLYISRREKKEYDTMSGQHIQINVNTDDESPSSDEKDQAMLDNSKTVVTVIRHARDGSTIFRSELTLLTYGDIEEATMRFAASLSKKVPINDTRAIDNITRREGMGHNKLFADKIKGVRVGIYYPAVFKAVDTSISTFVTICYHMRFDADRFYLEMAAGGRIPGEFTNPMKRYYGGFNLEIGGGYFIYNGVVGAYTGGGLNPFIDVLNGAQMGVAPYIQAGVTLPRNSRVRFTAEVRVAQNVLALTTGAETDTSLYYATEHAPKYRAYPTEIGMNFGIGF